MTQAAVLPAAQTAVEIREVPVREPGAGEVLMRMEACGICHSDLFVAGLEKLPLTPLILGHEGIGRVEAVGSGVEQIRTGDRAGITFLASSCGICELCATGSERFCAKQRNSGYTVHGALAGYATVAAQHLARVPDGMSAAQTAPLCCAGWTAYRAVREAGLAAGRKIALFGMGGLGHLAVQYARHCGLRVAAADVSEEKLEMARELGAEFTALAENAGRALQKEYGGVDAAVVLTASVTAIGQAFRSLKRTGTMVLAGLPSSHFELPVVDSVLKGISIRGSFLGTKQDLLDVFQLAREGIGRPHVEAHALSETARLMEKMRRGELRGRAVVVWD